MAPLLHTTSARLLPPLDPILTLHLGGDDDGTPSRLGGQSMSSLISSVCFVGGVTTTSQSSIGDYKSYGDDDDKSNDENNSNSSSSSDDDDFASLRLRSQSLVEHEASRRRQRRRAHNGSSSASSSIRQQHQQQSARQAAASMALLGRYLATCTTGGECDLWDLGRQRRQDKRLLAPNRGPGLLLRRCSDDDSDTLKLIYQTRNPEGTVSLHDLQASADIDRGGAVPAIATVETYSQTFCTAAPCRGNPNLVALPWHDETTAVVHDWRCPSPCALVHGVTGFVSSSSSSSSSTTIRSEVEDASETTTRQHGMLTSLALTEDNSNESSSQGLVLACGFESGSLFFHDLRFIRPNNKDKNKPFVGAVGPELSQKPPPCRIDLSKDPILSLDMVPSSRGERHQQSSPCSKHHDDVSSVIAIAAMASDAAEQSELPKQDRGAIAVVKSSSSSSSSSSSMSGRAGEEPQPEQRISMRRTARIRTRLSTCDIEASHGKPGSSICRFRPPDGRLFAIGGWDYRLRVFDRAVTRHRGGSSSYSTNNNQPLAILRGHTASVRTLDWAPDADTSGLLATGGADGQVNIWRCFSKPSPTA